MLLKILLDIRINPNKNLSNFLDPLRGALVVIRRPDRDFTAAQRKLLDALRPLLAILIRLHEAVFRSEEARVRFDTIVQTLPHGLVFTDDNGTDSWLNDAAASLLKLQRGNLPPYQLAEAMIALRKRADNHEQIWSSVGPLLSRANAELRDQAWIFSAPLQVLSVTTVPTNFRKARGRLWIFIDITALHAARRQVEDNNAELANARFRADDANAAKTLFLANMSHAVRWLSSHRWLCP